MDIGTLLLMPGPSYGLGLLFDDLLPGMLPERIWRVAAYPFLGIGIAEALLPTRILTFDPSFGSVHVITALIGALVAVIVDWAITRATPVVGATVLRAAAGD